MSSELRLFDFTPEHWRALISWATTSVHACVIPFPISCLLSQTPLYLLQLLYSRFPTVQYYNLCFLYHILRSFIRTLELVRKYKKLLNDGDFMNEFKLN